MAWRDKYRIMLFGSFGDRPDVGDVDQWYRVTEGTVNLGKLYKGTGTGWVEVPWPDLPYAAVNHTHPLSQIETPSDYMWLGIPGTSPGANTPTGLVYRDRVPPIYVSGTKLEVVALVVTLSSGPIEGLEFQFAVEGTVVGAVSVLAGRTVGYIDLESSPVEVCPSQEITILAPSDTKEATGLGAYFVIRRAVGSSKCAQGWADIVSGQGNLTYAIDVSWVEGAPLQVGDGFRIYRSVDGGAYTLLATVPVTQTTYRDNAIDYGSTYQYRIVEYKGAEESPYVETAAISVPAS